MQDEHLKGHQLLGSSCRWVLKSMTDDEYTAWRIKRKVRVCDNNNHVNPGGWGTPIKRHQDGWNSTKGEDSFKLISQSGDSGFRNRILDWTFSVHFSCFILSKLIILWCKIYFKAKDVILYVICFWILWIYLFYCWLLRYYHFCLFWEAC